LLQFFGRLISAHLPCSSFRLFVALLGGRDLLLCAKHLLVGAKLCGCGLESARPNVRIEACRGAKKPRV